MPSTTLLFSEQIPGVLTAPSKCGLVAIPQFLRQVVNWSPAHHEPLIIDLSGVAEIDSEAILTLVWAHRYCAERGRPLAFVGPATGVLTSREDVLLRALLPVYSDVTRARAGFVARGAFAASAPPE